MRALSIGLILAAQASFLLVDSGSAHGGEKGPKAKPEKANVHVLGPGSEKAISNLLKLSEKLSDGSALNATIKESAILVTAGSAKKPVLSVTLVHRKDAPKGAVRAGDLSVVSTPGPSPSGLLKELVARIKTSKVTLPWQKVVAKPTAEDIKREKEEAAERAKQEKILRAKEARLKASEKMLARASNLISLGDKEKATKLLSMIATVENNGLIISIAIQLTRAGEKRQAIKMLGDVKNPTISEALSLKLLRGKLPRGPKAIKGVPSKAACDLAMVAAQALDLKRYKEAESLSQAIRKAAPGCVKAWETELRALAELKAPIKTQKIRVEAALKEVGNTSSIHQIASEVYRFGGDSLRSIEEAVLAARANPKEPGRLEGLARIMSEDPAVLLTYLEKVIKQEFKGNAALVRDFAIGVAYHLAHHYEKSQQYLLPLEMVFRSTPILKVYLALNEFNLGAKEQAAKRLKKARVRTEHDVELYYFRAEVLRDTDRKKAISDLTKLLPQLTKSSKGSATEERRVRSLLAALKVCADKKTKICPGDWLHPKTAGKEGQPKITIPPALLKARPLHIATSAHSSDKRQGAKNSKGKTSGAPEKKPGAETPSSDDNPELTNTEENPLLIILLGLGLLIGFVVLRKNTL